jgi:site-specific recombinase XerD
LRAELARLGYTPLSAASKLRLVAHLSRWLTTQGLDISALTRPTIEAYFAERRSAGFTNERSPVALEPVLDYLRRLGAAPVTVTASPTTPTEQMLAGYTGYLKLERGLVASTAELNARLLRPFLTTYGVEHDGVLELGHLSARDVASFVVCQSAERPRSAKPLAESVPSPAGWALTGLPKALSEGEVAALLASCDPKRPAGRRDLAMLTLLARLGLRAGEVAGLGLDDIDWRRGELVVRGKGRRVDRLPLPADVGEKVVAYLRHGRPRTTGCRTVFVTAVAPHRPLSPCGVTTAVGAAARRAGLGTVHAHRLRHSAATGMLRNGASLREIGDVLRHRRAMTTAIYAKLDLAALRSVARPWPGAGK